MSANPSVTINLGAEHDSALWSRLKRAVSALGGAISEVSYSVGGSQEVIEFRITLPSGVLTLVSETYIGLVLSGPPALVDQVAHALRDA